MRKIIPIILLLVIIVLSAAFVWLNFSIGTLSGKIYLTLKPDQPNTFTQIYSFDLSSKKLEKLENDGFVIITNSFLPGNQVQAFAVFNFGEPMQIYTGNADMTYKKKITRSQTQLKRLPAWSPDGQYIAFAAKDSNEGDLLVPDNWKVYITDLEGNERLISPGSHPMFSPDGKEILALRNDGLYLFDVADKISGKRVLPIVNGSAFLSMKLSLSKDKKMLAWTDIGKSRVYLYKIDSWDKFSINRVKEISVNAFWPVFSPDGKHLALQEIDKVGTTNPRLIAYNLETLEKEKLIDLSEYLQEGMFVTDWQP